MYSSFTHIHVLGNLKATVPFQSFHCLPLPLRTVGLYVYVVLVDSRHLLCYTLLYFILYAVNFMPTDSEIPTDNPKVFQLICGNLQILRPCDQTFVQMWGLFCRCFKTLWVSGPPMAEAATCQLLHVDFFWTKWHWDRNFVWYVCVNKHYSTSAPYSYVIHPVLTVNNHTNCHRHRNIYPSLGQDAKHYDFVVKTAEAVACTSHVINWTLIIPAVWL